MPFQIRTTIMIQQTVNFYLQIQTIEQIYLHKKVAYYKIRAPLEAITIHLTT